MRVKKDLDFWFHFVKIPQVTGGFVKYEGVVVKIICGKEFDCRYFVYEVRIYERTTAHELEVALFIEVVEKEPFLKETEFNCIRKFVFERRFEFSSCKLLKRVNKVN